MDRFFIQGRKSMSALLFAGILLLGGCIGDGSPRVRTSHVAATSLPTGPIERVAPLYGTQLRGGDSVRLCYTLRSDAKPDSVVLILRDKRIGPIDTAGYRLILSKNHPTGRTAFTFTAYTKGAKQTLSGEFRVMAATAPTAYSYRIVNTYPHDPTAYTQGLLWHQGFLYESTGLEGASSLRKVELESGKVVQSRMLPDAWFGEGLTLLNDTLYQLTWQNGKAALYTLQELKPVGEFDYRGEGWGIATDGKWLYQSDGTEKIRVLDPATFKAVRTIEVYTNQRGVAMLNELEWIDGELWANLYMSDQIIRIDPLSGAVKGVIELSGLLPDSLRDETTDVLNGIAYDASTRRIWVTGKNWSRLYEIRLLRKP